MSDSTGKFESLLFNYTINSSIRLKSISIDPKSIFHNILITNLGLCFQALEGCNVNKLLATSGFAPRSLKYSLVTHNPKVTGSLNILEIAHKDILYFIYSSSSFIYGFYNLIYKK